MATLDDFRQLPQYKDFSDEQLVVTLSQKYGIEPGEIAQEFGVSYNPQRNPLGAGLSAGVDQLQGLGYGAIGAGSRALGAEGVADWADRGVTRNYAEATFNGRADLERIEDQSLGSALPFLGYQVAKQVPMLAGTLAASAAVPQAAIPAALSRGLAVIPKGLGGGGLKAGMDFAGRRAALEAGNAFGRTIAASYPIGVGAMYGEAVERGDPTQGDALAALGLGVPYGAAEAVMPSMVRNAFGSNAARFAGGLPTRLAKAGGLGFAGESSTELFQNELEMGFAGNLTQDEIDSRRLNSAVIGGLVGGTFNLPAGFRGQRNPADPIDILNRDTSPQAEAVPQVGQSELNFGVTGEEAIGTRGLRNPFDAAGYVSGFQQGQETTVDVPQSDLFGGANERTPVDIPRAPKIDVPVPQPLQSDPVRSAVAQASPATLRRDGSLKRNVEETITQYNGLPFSEIERELESLESSRKAEAVWRVAALEAIARQRAAQGAPNVAQVDAASGQGAGVVPAGSAGNAPSGPVVLDGVRQPAGAPAPGSAAGIPVGEPIVQQPSGLTEGAQPTNVPPTQQVAAQAEEARGQEGAQSVAAQTGVTPPARPTEDTPEARAAYIGELRGFLNASVAAQPQEVTDAMRAVFGGFKQVSDVASALMNARKGLIEQHQERFGAAPDAAAIRKIDAQLAKLHKQMSENADDPVTTSLRAAARDLGVSHETVRTRMNKGVAALQQAATEAGIDIDAALEMTGVKPSAVLAYMDSISESEAAQMGLSYRRSGPRTTRNAGDDAFNLDDAGADYFEEGLGGAVDEDAQADAGVQNSTIDAQAATDQADEGVDFDAMASEERGRAERLAERTNTFATERDHNGNPLRDVDFQEAAEDYNESVDTAAGGLSFEQLDRARQVAYTKAYVANMDGVLSAQQLMRVFGDIADATRAKQDAQADDQRATQEEGAVAQVQGTVQGGREGGAETGRAAREEVTSTPAFRRWFGDSKVVDVQGNPLVVYHGTRGDFSVFSEDMIGSATDRGFAGPAFYFTNNANSASSYAEPGARNRDDAGGNVMPVHLKIERPYYVPEGQDTLTPEQEQEAHSGRYDGIINRLAEDDGYVEYAVFRPEQIKSATGNNGQFDGANPDIRYSRTTDTQGTTVEAVRSAINDIATPAGNRKITVVQSADELIERGILNSSQARGTQGYVTRKGDAYFIADNIRPGNELAVVLHEIGAHLGIENLLTDKQYETLVKKIFDWAQSSTDSPESRIARAAIRRVAQAKIENEAGLSPETIAYFIEEAVKAGVNPTAMQYKTELGRWFRTLWAAFKVALRRLNLINADRLTAQNVVDLAYGAARVSLAGQYHGTAAEPQLTRNLVIFNDANIFRVGSMRGGPVDKGGRMMFSKIDTSTPEGFFDAIRNRTADFFINPVGFMKEHGLGWLTLEQLADVVKSKSVSGYHRVMVAMQQFSKDRVHDAAIIDVEWAKLSSNEQSRLSTVMRGATRASYDPENETPANDEQRTLNDQYEALTPAAKDIYLKVREYYSKNFEERKKILLDAANRAKAAGKNTSEVERMFAKVKGPYFPLMRIGGWYSVGMSPELAELMDKKERNEASAAELKRIETLRKDAKHYVSRGHTTRRDAELSRRELQAQLGVAYANRAEERIGQEVAQLPDMAKLEEYLAPHLPVGVRSQVRDMLAQAYFDALPEKSALKRQLKREGVHGEEEDMRRVFAASALSSAHHISRLKYANDLSEAMVKVRAEGRRDETLRMVGNELNKRTALALEMQENPIVDRVLQVSYFANLGLSPAFLLTNMTQVPMITAPWLGARHGFAKATRALAEAFTDTKDMVRATYAGKGVKDGWRSEFDWSQKYPEGTDEHKLFRALLDRNLLDITMEHDLTAVAEVRNTKIDDAIKIANLPVRVTETVNRSITGLAAYRLARADGKSHEQAVEHAAKALSETQLNYSGLNTARHMQVVLGSKALARLMMQFRKFQQGMVYLIVKNAYDAVKAQGGTEAETKELRRIARKTLAGVFGTTGLMAGTLGLPFAGTVATVVGAVGGMLDDDDEPFDPVVEYRNFLTDMFGPEMAAVLAKGLPTLMNVDLSKRVGMGDIGTPLPFMRQGRTGTEAVNNTLGAAAGAWAGTTASMLDGIAFLANGDYAKAAEKIIPIKAAQNLVRGYRYDDQGLTNRNGELVVPAEKFSAWDIALRTAGFQPMREAEYYEANRAVEGAKRAAQDTRTKLLRQYAQAKLRGEPTADVDAEIKAFNERHPQKGLRIDYSARARAVQARRKMADERNEAGVRVDRTGAPFEERGRFAAP